ncbi:hypothetical protein SNE40_020433 [Patella caerulea]|uniref:Metalloendopeptidase n=1 Tax=Patella caerulea TaxID=87958 RepID=A0AAN8IYK0_PATCE
MKTILFLLSVIGVIYSIPIQKPIGGHVAGVFDENFPEENPGLFEGDIELEPGENIYDRNAILNKDKLWPNGVVPYSISSTYSSAQQAVIKNAMHTIEEKTKVHGKTCIHFTPHSHQRQYIKFVDGTGCHTPAGMRSDSTPVTLSRYCIQTGIVMHEINHALGMMHEQSRPDRDDYVTIVESNIQKGQELNFIKFKQLDELGQSYDYASLMHYGAHAYAIDKSKPTIIPKQKGVRIGQRAHLSPIDIKEIQILYGCLPRPH